MKTYKSILMLVVLLSVSFSWAQQTPASKQKEAITIEGATAHLGNGEVIENSLVIFEGGKITFVGDAKMKIARKGKTIDGTGKHIYPGFIAPTKALGLTEIDAVRASRDEDEIGEFIPHVRSLIAYNAESKVVESMRPNGVLLAQITPQGGEISGTSSIVQLDAWNWEDAAVKVDDGIHLHWPSSFRFNRRGDDRGYKPNDNYQESIAQITSFLQSSKAYGQTNAKEEHAPFKAMQGVFNGSQKLYIYANGEKEIIDAITLAKSEGIKSIVLVGGYEAYKITDFLKQHNIPVLVQATHNRPRFEDEDYDLPYKLPKLLTDAGLLVGIQNASADNFQTRNLPFYAGQVAGQGLEKEKALALITGNTAKILGIDDSYGTLETGKSATLFLSKGDALDMRTNQLLNAFIDGREVSLETHQTELWKRYMTKYENQ
ncbi:amidohydrolase family protein [Formosa sediminum]|uniref:Amidohydrolase family protein n=1 Tax=Formosa sediminum TaxID=2594004 RepID=A0A516GNG7_9FLAO|nr:amidohydrolase family protein [Formosa sediminum]QDO93067.1 amidohydrolase family protein [Formosa sediminum]